HLLQLRCTLHSRQGLAVAEAGQPSGVLLQTQIGSQLLAKPPNTPWRLALHGYANQRRDFEPPGSARLCHDLFAARARQEVENDTVEALARKAPHGWSERRQVEVRSGLWPVRQL